MQPVTLRRVFNGPLRGHAVPTLVLLNLISRADHSRRAVGCIRAISEDTGASESEVKYAIMRLEATTCETSPGVFSPLIERVAGGGADEWIIGSEFFSSELEERRRKNREAQRRFREKRSENKPRPKKPATEKTAIQLRCEKLKNRTSERPWNKSEIRAFSNSRQAIESTPEADWITLEKFYALPQSETFSRKDLSTLLNNWNGEIDRARSYFARKGVPAPRVRNGPTLKEVADYCREKWAEENWSNWASSFHVFWDDPKRDWKKNGMTIDWKIELGTQVAKWRSEKAKTGNYY